MVRIDCTGAALFHLVLQCRGRTTLLRFTLLHSFDKLPLLVTVLGHGDILEGQAPRIVGCPVDRDVPGSLRDRIQHQRKSPKNCANCTYKFHDWVVVLRFASYTDRMDEVL
jgi:hypothetical protein